MSERSRIIVAFAIIYVVWGSTYLAIRVGVPYIPSAIFAGVRFLIAGVILLVALAAARRPLRPSRRDLITLAAAGFLLLVTGNGLVILAEETVPSGLAALVIATVPLWAAGLEAVLPGGEALSGRGVIGILLGLGGLVVLSWPELSGAAGAQLDLRGIGLLVVASASWAAGTLLIRRRPLRLSALTATGWEMLLGGAFNLALGLAFQGRRPILWSQELLLSLAYLVVFGSLIAFTAYVWLAQRVAPAKITTYAYVNPVIAVFLGWWLLQEPIDATVLGGLAMIVPAVLLVTSAQVRRRPAARPRRGPIAGRPE
jgi:drug/metabolite transporter (DMT)-like permease